MTSHILCPDVHTLNGVAERCSKPYGHDGEHEFSEQRRVMEAVVAEAERRANDPALESIYAPERHLVKRLCAGPMGHAFVVDEATESWSKEPDVGPAGVAKALTTRAAGYRAAATAEPGNEDLLPEIKSVDWGKASDTLTLVDATGEEVAFMGQDLVRRLVDRYRGEQP